MFDSTKDKENQKNHNAILSALMQSAGGLFSKLRTKIKPILGPIFQILGSIFSIVNKFVQNIFGGMKDNPVAQDIVQKTEELSSATNKIARSHDPLKALIDESYYQKNLPGFNLFGNLYNLLLGDESKQETAKPSQSTPRRDKGKQKI